MSAQLRSAVQVAIDALEVGDVAFAVEVLLGALEDGPAERRYHCPVCAVPLEWPELLREHRRVVHPVLAEAA